MKHALTTLDASSALMAAFRLCAGHGLVAAAGAADCRTQDGGVSRKPAPHRPGIDVDASGGGNAAAPPHALKGLPE